ncbi:MAG: peroxiredoxin family protein [Verrucomicrobiia bacterium]
MKANPSSSIFVLLFGTALMMQAENPRDFTLESPTHGTTFSLSASKGKHVALHFLLKTECPFCLKHTHDFAALAATTPDVVHVFIEPDSAVEIKAWSGNLSNDGLKELPAIYRDPDAKLAQAFGIPDSYQFHGQVVHYPALVLLRPDGKEVFRFVGKNNSDRMSVADFKARVAPAAPGTAPSASSPDPRQSLPPHITWLTWFGERADWRHDGQGARYLGPADFQEDYLIVDPVLGTGLVAFASHCAVVFEYAP